MVQIDLTYQGNLRCEAVHAPSGTALLTDAPKDNHGLGTSFSPTDLVATALASCMLTTMAIVARKLGLNIDGARASVEKEMIASPVRRIGTLTVNIAMPSGIDPAHRKQLEQAAYHCPVHESMHPDLAMPVTFNWQ